MSELHIRINKRTFERILFTVIILVLGALLLFQQPASVDTEQVQQLRDELSSLNDTNADLRAQVASLQEQVQALEAQNQNLTEQQEQAPAEQEQASQEPEEPALSGEVAVDWSVTMNDNALDYVTIVLDNGLESTQELTYELVWNDATYRSNNVNARDTVIVSSGERETVVVDDYISNPGEDIDTLLLEVSDEDGEYILHPGDFVLGTTHERVEIPDDLIAHVEGRSSLGHLRRTRGSAASR